MIKIHPLQTSQIWYDCLAVQNLCVGQRPQRCSGNEDPIYEIRYKAFKRQERALGYFEDGTSSFIIVLICHHKGRVYKPPKAFEIAHRRIKEIQSGSATNVPLQVDGEDFPPHDEKPG